MARCRGRLGGRKRRVARIFGPEGRVEVKEDHAPENGRRTIVHELAGASKGGLDAISDALSAFMSAPPPAVWIRQRCLEVSYVLITNQHRPSLVIASHHQQSASLDHQERSVTRTCCWPCLCQHHSPPTDHFHLRPEQHPKH